MTNKILWNPPISLIENSNIIEFQNIINHKYNLSIKKYSELYKWSISNIDDFWEEIWNYSKIIYSHPYTKVIKTTDNIWETNWFIDSKLNYAENLLRYKNDSVAIYFFGEDEIAKTLTFNDLYKEVANVAYTLKKMGYIIFINPNYFNIHSI